jgi:hypothetical protein
LTTEGGRDGALSDGVATLAVVTCGMVMGPAVTVGVVIGGTAAVGVVIGGTVTVAVGTVTDGTDTVGLGPAALEGAAETANTPQARNTVGTDRITDEIAAREHAQPLPRLSANDGANIPQRLSTGLFTLPFTRLGAYTTPRRCRASARPLERATVGARSPSPSKQ